MNGVKKGQVMDYDKRQQMPVVLTPELAHDLWSAIKGMRDEAMNIAHQMEVRRDQFDDLLKRLEDNGGADHLPTLDEVLAAFRKE